VAFTVSIVQSFGEKNTGVLDVTGLTARRDNSEKRIGAVVFGNVLKKRV